MYSKWSRGTPVTENAAFHYNIKQNLVTMMESTLWKNGGKWDTFWFIPFSPFFLGVTNFRRGTLIKKVSKYPVEKWGGE